MIWWSEIERESRVGERFSYGEANLVVRVRVGEREQGFPMQREREREREVVREKVFLCRAKLTTDSNCPPFTGAGAG